MGNQDKPRYEVIKGALGYSVRDNTTGGYVGPRWVSRKQANATKKRFDEGDKK